MLCTVRRTEPGEDWNKAITDLSMKENVESSLKHPMHHYTDEIGISTETEVRNMDVVYIQQMNDS